MVKPPTPIGLHNNNIVVLGRWNELVLLGDDAGRVVGGYIQPREFDDYVNHFQGKHEESRQATIKNRLADRDWVRRAMYDGEYDLEAAAGRDVRPVRLRIWRRESREMTIPQRPKPMVVPKLEDEPWCETMIELKTDRVVLKDWYVRRRIPDRMIEVKVGYHDREMTWHKGGGSILWDFDMASERHRKCQPAKWDLVA